MPVQWVATIDRVDTMNAGTFSGRIRQRINDRRTERAVPFDSVNVTVNTDTQGESAVVEVMGPRIITEQMTRLFGKETTAVTGGRITDWTLRATKPGELLVLRFKHRERTVFSSLGSTADAESVSEMNRELRGAVQAARVRGDIISTSVEAPFDVLQTAIEYQSETHGDGPHASSKAINDLMNDLADAFPKVDTFHATTA